MDANTCLQLLLNNQLNPQEAEATASQALSLEACDPQWALSLGYALWLQGRFSEAREICRHHRHLLDSHVDFLVLHGMVARRLPDSEEEALRAYVQAQHLDPNRADVAYNLGNLHLHAERYSEAVEQYVRSLGLDGSNAMAWLNLGIAHRELDQHDEARRALGRSIQLDPEHPDPWANLGIVALAEGRVLPSMAFFRHSLQVSERSSAPALRLPAWSLAHAAEPLELDPRLGEKAEAPVTRSADALFNLSLTRLLQGDYTHGWPLYEYRRDGKQFEGVVAPSSGAPISRISQLDAVDSQGVLVWCEQGLGDAIQFCRYLPLLQARGLRVALSSRPPLIPLFRDWLSWPLDEVLDERDMNPNEEFRPHLPMLSLPPLFSTELTSIPATIPYLRPPGPPPGHLLLPEPLGGLAVGMVWGSSPLNRRMVHHKSWPLLQLLQPLLGTIDNGLLYLHSLQVSAEREQLLPLLPREGITDWAPMLNNFSDTAHVVSQLDLVITADTAVAHLAAALEIPTWLLLPFNADFRWLQGIEHSPWYPGMRLFRQPRPHDWSQPMQAIVEALGMIYGLDLPALETL